MDLYYTLEAGPDRAMILAARGTEQHHTLADTIPPDNEAVVSVPLPSGLTTSSLEATLGHLFGEIALSNPAKQLLLRVRDHLSITAWVIGHERRPST
jgi:hypothetical protein